MQTSKNVPTLSAVELLALADLRAYTGREDQHRMLFHAQVTAQIATAQATIELKASIDALREAVVNLQGG